ncbi:MAG TPA: hypothetical protein V6D20_04795 [Candidatus Obscuribacterales bacterium]
MTVDLDVGIDAPTESPNPAPPQSSDSALDLGELDEIASLGMEDITAGTNLSTTTFVTV